MPQESSAFSSLKANVLAGEEGACDRLPQH
jgi:hypothetical protein